jgi:hypothetical protein
LLSSATTDPFVGTLAVLIVASQLPAQTSPPDGRLLSPSVDTFSVSYGTQIIGQGVQVTEQVFEAGAATWKQTYTFVSTRGTISTDTLLMDARTLRPIREARVSDAGRFRFEFRADEIISISLTDTARPVTTRARLVPGTYASAALAAVVRSLPLADGLQVTLSLFYPLPSQRGSATLVTRVLRSEPVSVRDQSPRAAWVVVAGAPGEATTFWIDKQDRRVLQFDTEEGSALIRFRR